MACRRALERGEGEDGLAGEENTLFFTLGSLPVIYFLTGLPQSGTRHILPA